jgi:predicted ATPase
LSAKAIGALERGERRAPYRETVRLLAHALALSPQEGQAFEDAAARARRRGARFAFPVTEAPNNNLTPRLTSFVGRDREVAEIDALLRKHRLVTVTGAGGVGKTRTAVEVAALALEDWEDGVWFADLSSLSDERLVLSRIASAVNIKIVDGHDLLVTIITALKMARLLLILDNCEHIIGEVSGIARELAQACPNVTILATSRERLGLTAEAVYRLPGLPTPERHVSKVSEGLDYAAIALFAERAAAIDNRFELTDDRVDIVADICRDLDGLALAIELAAAQVPQLGLLTLRERLREQVIALSAGARDRPQRQQTMRSTIAWSYDLLSLPERTLFDRLAIFEGGWTLEAAESVCAHAGLHKESILGLLSSLVAKSLVVAGPSMDKVRYAFSEPTRAFAREQFVGSQELEALHRRHATWLAGLSEAADRTYLSAPRQLWLANAEREIGNARAALRWAVETGHDAALAGTIIGGLRGLWRTAGLAAECREWAEAALEQLDVERHPAIAARLYRTIAQATYGASRIAAAKRELSLLQRLGNRTGIAASLVHLARGLSETGDASEALAAIDTTKRIYREEGLQYELPYARAQYVQCQILHRQGRSDEIGEDLQDALATATTYGDEWIALDLKVLLAEVAFDKGDAREAARLAKEALEVAQTRRWQIEEINILNNLSVYAMMLGDIDGAETASKEVLSLSRAREPLAFVLGIQHLSTVAALRGHYPRAARLLGGVDAWCSRERWERGPTEMKGHELLFRILNENLSEPVLRTLKADGAGLSEDQISAEALLA